MGVRGKYLRARVVPNVRSSHYTQRTAVETIQYTCSPGLRGKTATLKRRAGKSVNNMALHTHAY
jgi:hypothetical protein